MVRNRTQRDRLEILGRILEASIEGVNKARLMQRCNLSHKHLILNLEELLANGLLESFNYKGKVIYVTTETGRYFLDSFRMLTSLLYDACTEVFTQYLSQKDKGYQS
jgi:predicted transcriptional regulator